MDEEIQDENLEQEDDQGATPVTETAPPTQLDEAKVQQMIAEAVAAAVQGVQAATPAPLPVAQPIVDPKTPWEIAQAEADAAAEKGILMTDNQIQARVSEIQAQQSEQRILSMIAPMLVPIAREREVRRVVGDNQQAQEYAEKLIAKGLDTSDPDVAEMVRRASQSYAQEKAPPSATVTVQSSNTARPNTQVSEERAEVDELSRIAAETLGYGGDDAKLLFLADADLERTA